MAERNYSTSRVGLAQALEDAAMRRSSKPNTPLASALNQYAPKPQETGGLSDGIMSALQSYADEATGAFARYGRRSGKQRDDSIALMNYASAPGTDPLTGAGMKALGLAGLVTHPLAFFPTREEWDERLTNAGNDSRMSRSIGGFLSDLPSLIDPQMAAGGAVGAMAMIPGRVWRGKMPTPEQLAQHKDKFLFHSGVSDDAKNMAGGIEPQSGGPWIREVAAGATDDVDDLLERSTPLAWFSDAPDWVKAKVSRATGKHVSQVTDEDIAKYGHLAIVNKKSEDLQSAWKVGDEGLSNGEYSIVHDIKGRPSKAYETSLYGEDNYGNRTEPFGVERNEWVSTEPVEPLMQLTGDDLVNYLRAYNTKPQVGTSPSTVSRDQALKGLVGGGDEGFLAYHGTPEKGVQRLSTRNAIETPGAVFASNRDDVAETFTQPREYGEPVFYDEAGNDIPRGEVLELSLKPKNVMTYPEADGQRFIEDSALQARAVREAKAAGHDMIHVKNVKEGIGERMDGDVYVVLDDRIITILRRYGIPMTAGAGGAMMVAGQDMPPDIASQMGGT